MSWALILSTSSFPLTTPAVSMTTPETATGPIAGHHLQGRMGRGADIRPAFLGESLHQRPLWYFMHVKMCHEHHLSLKQEKLAVPAFADKDKNPSVL